MLKTLSTISAHLNSNEDINRWLNRGGKGILLTYNPYYVIFYEGNYFKHLIYRSKLRQWVNVSGRGWSINCSSVIFFTPIAFNWRIGPDS